MKTKKLKTVKHKNADPKFGYLTFEFFPFEILLKFFEIIFNFYNAFNRKKVFQKFQKIKNLKNY